MSFAPYVVLWVILLVAAAVCLIAGRRNVIQLASSLVAALSAFAIWFFFQPSPAARIVELAGRQWVVDGPAWGLTGIALLLLLSALIHAALHNDAAEAGGVRSAWLLGLTAAALPAVWSADDRSRILALALFVLVWAAARLRYSHGNARTRFDWSWLVASLFPLWLGAAWPGGRSALALLAAGMLMGSWPFDGRWRDGVAGDAALRLMMNVLPMVAGAAVLASVGAAAISGVVIGVATAFGLFNLFVGLIRAWRLPFNRLAESFGPALAGLALVAVAWSPTGASHEALLPATRLAVFVPAILMLAASLASHEDSAGVSADEPRRPAVSPGLIGSVVAFAAVGGLPLTAGFAALAWLYWAGLMIAAGWALIVLLIIVLSLWLAAAWQIVRDMAGRFDRGQTAWLRGVALLLPAIGLLQFNTGSVEPELIGWIIVPIPFVAGLLLGYFGPGRRALDERLAAALSALPLSRAPLNRSRRYGQAAADAVADAVAILDGDFGLLWLIGLILLLLWII